MANKLLRWFIIGIIVILSFWALQLYAEIFSLHMPFFLFIWLFLPIFAFWFCSQPIHQKLSLSELISLRKVLTGVAILVSISVFFNFNPIRDFVGEYCVDGYQVTYNEETGDFGQTIETGQITTDHWYSRFGLWIFEWIIFLACFILPCLTWFGFAKAVNSASQKA